MTTEPDTAPADGTVTYEASVTGSATIKSVVYRGPGEPVTVSNPTVPFEVDVAVAGGTELSMTAYGSIDNGDEGNIFVRFDFLEASGASFYSTAQCR